MSPRSERQQQRAVASIDFEATTNLTDSGFDGNTVAIHFGEDDQFYVNDPFLSPQELLDEVTRILFARGYLRLALIPRDVENGAPPKFNIFARMVIAVRSLTVDEVGG